jgi:hypothetical protein
MATIAGTITGGTLLYKEPYYSGGRECWLLTCSFGAYTASADDASLANVGATIDGYARDGKTSTLRGAIPVQGMPAAAAGTGTVVYFSGATVQALTVSSDSLTGELNSAALTETDSIAASGCAIAVIVDRA